MNSLMINVFIFILNLYLLVNAIKKDVIELGQSSCKYAGDHDGNTMGCYAKQFELSKLPKNECTSYVYDGVTCLSNSTIQYNYSPFDLSNIKMLTNLSSKVFLFYGSQNLNFWNFGDFNQSIQAEIKNLKTFLDEYPVAGLILTGIINPSANLSETFYDDMEIYVKNIKTVKPNITVGFYCDAATMIHYRNDTKWFNFTLLDKFMDFYLITFYEFNHCNQNIGRGGLVPMDSDNFETNTLKRLSLALNASTIPKEKVYFEFVLTPVVDIIVSHLTHCQITYEQYCETKNTDNTTVWCVDTEKSFSEKGQFAKEHAKGWVGSYIDLIDRNTSCGCNGDPFISFHMILDAYNNKTVRTCKVFKN